MRALLLLTVSFLSGCRMPEGFVVTTSAYVEAERPEGRAVAKVELNYRPPAHATRDVAVAAATPAEVTLGAPLEIASR